MATKMQGQGAEQTGTESVDLLQPEVMSREELITTLQQKQVAACDLGNMDMDGLLEVYYKSILPMPQRKYRLNRRGQLATEQQITLVKSRKRSYEKISEGSATPEVNVNRSQSSGLITSFRLPQSTPTGDRLKPVNPDRKVIRLKPKSPATSLSDIVINQRNTTSKNNTKATDTYKPIQQNVEKPFDAAAKSKVIKLNRISFSSDKDCHVTQKNSIPSPTSMDLSPKAHVPKEAAGKESPDTPEGDVSTKKFKTVSIKWP